MKNHLPIQKSSLLIANFQYERPKKIFSNMYPEVLENLVGCRKKLKENVMILVILSFLYFRGLLLYQHGADCFLNNAFCCCDKYDLLLATKTSASNTQMCKCYSKAILYRSAILSKMKTCKTGIY